MATKARNCFVSYHHDWDQNYMHKLRNKISGMSVADYSLKDDIGHFNEETIYKKVREKMRSCSVTIVLIGECTGHRESTNIHELVFLIIKGLKRTFSKG